MRASKSIKETLITLIIDNTEPSLLWHFLSPTYPETFSEGGLLFDIGDGSDGGGGGGGSGGGGDSLDGGGVGNVGGSGGGGDILDSGGNAQRGFKFA